MIKTYKIKMDKIAKQLGFKSWFDLKWSIQSFLYQPIARLEDLTCRFLGHNPNLNAVIGSTTYCRRCVTLLEVNKNA